MRISWVPSLTAPRGTAERRDRFFSFFLPWRRLHFALCFSPWRRPIVTKDEETVYPPFGGDAIDANDDVQNVLAGLAGLAGADSLLRGGKIDKEHSMH